MMREALFLASLLVLSAALEELPAPELASSQLEKVTKIITEDEKACQSQLDDLEHEYQKRQLRVTNYEKQISTVRTTYELNQRQLQQELSSIQEVRSMIQTVISGSSFSAISSSVSSAQSSVNTLESSSAKMAGVLRNIVTSVSAATNTSGVPVNIDMTEVFSLISTLESNIKTAMQVDSLTHEEKSIREKITVEKALLETLQKKIDALKSECHRRQSQFTEIVTVLKVIQQKYQNVSVPNCQVVIDDKTKSESQWKIEKQDLTNRIKETEMKLEACKNQPAAEKCTDSSAKVAEQSKVIEKLTTELQAAKESNSEMRTQLTKSTSEKTVIESKLVETRKELTRVTVIAQCEDQREHIRQLENRIHQLSIKAELGEKCAINFKSQQLEKNEMLKQLEKMSVISGQLTACQFQSARAAKECTDSVQVANKAHVASIEKMTAESRRLNQEISRLQEEAKCNNERSVIEKYEKEMVTVKTETRTVVTQVESDVRGCEAEIQTYKALRAADQDKINQYFSKIATLQQQLEILKADHAGCLETHTTTKSECQVVQTRLASCQSTLQSEVSRVTSEHSIIVKLNGEKQTLNAEVNSLETEESTLKSQIKAMATRITTQEGTVVTLTRQVSEHETEERKLTTAQSEAEAKLHSQISEITTLKKRMEAISVSLVGEENGNEKLMAQLNNLREEQGKLQQAKIDAEGALAKVQGELAQLRAFKAAAEKHIKEARDAIALDDKRIDVLTAQVTKLGSRKTELLGRLSACDASLHTSEAALNSTRASLHQCHDENVDMRNKLAMTTEAAKCSAHKATIEELKKHGYALRVELRAAQQLKDKLTRDNSNLQGRLVSWQHLNTQLQQELKSCTEGHSGCHASVRALKTQMLGNLRRIKAHVSSAARLEERLAASQVELVQTKHQWHSDRTAYKAFKDNLLGQMSKLITLAKDAKHKFDVARAASNNELKVQDAQWAVCRKEVLNYERILGSGVVKAEKEKMKSYLASRRYAQIKTNADAALHNAQNSTSETREHQKSEQAVHEKMQSFAPKTNNFLV